MHVRNHSSMFKSVQLDVNCMVNTKQMNLSMPAAAGIVLMVQTDCVVIVLCQQAHFARNMLFGAHSIRRAGVGVFYYKIKVFADLECT